MASKWTTVSIANAPSGFVAGTMLLLTDGSVMIHGDTSANWMRLTPGTDPTQGGASTLTGRSRRPKRWRPYASTSRRAWCRTAGCT